MSRMPGFLIETWILRDALSIAAHRADGAPARCRAGLPARGPGPLPGAMVVPEEEACFYLHRASSVSAVRAAMALAGLRADRITTAIASGRHGPPGPHTWHRSAPTIPSARTACPEQIAPFCRHHGLHSQALVGPPVNGPVRGRMSETKTETKEPAEE